MMFFYSTHCTGREAELPSIPPHELQMIVRPTGSLFIHGSCTIRHINTQALQERPCVRSIQALARQPEAFSWRLLLDCHLFSHQLLAPLLCPGSNPIIRDAREGSAVGLSVNEQHRVREEGILSHPTVSVKFLHPENWVLYGGVVAAWETQETSHQRGLLD